MEEVSFNSRKQRKKNIELETVCKPLTGAVGYFNEILYEELYF